MTEIVQGAITIFLFFFILGALVLVHELGHFVTARLAGVRVLEFGIGFPPRAKVLRAKGETLYTLNWLPIGGFVKLEGEDGDEADDPRSFVRARLPVKLIILVAGVVDEPRHRVPDLHDDRLACDAVRRAPVHRGPAGLAGGRGRPQAGRRDPRGRRAASTSSSARASVLTELRANAGETVDTDARGSRPGRVATSRSRSGREEEIDASEGCEGGRPEGSARDQRQFESHFFGPYTGHDLPTRSSIGASETMRWFGLILGGLGDLVGDFVSNPTAPPGVRDRSGSRPRSATSSSARARS